MLTKKEIQEFAIIQDGDPECYDESNYNLRLGSDYILIGGEKNVRGNCTQVALEIPPFGCALVSTREWLKIPDRAYGRWGLKIRSALAGLIFQAGPQIEPGYKGRLFGILFNLSAQPYHAAYLEELWSIDFTQIGSDSLKPMTGDPKEKDMQIDSYMTKGIPHGGVSDSLAKLEKNQHELQELQNWIKEQKESWGQRLEDKAKALGADLQRELEALRKENAERTAKREAERNEENSGLRNQLGEAHKAIGDKTQYNTTLFVGVIVVLIAAFLPLIISKVTYDRDVIVTLLDGKNGLKEATKHASDNTEKLLKENEALRKDLEKTNAALAKLGEELDKVRLSATGADPSRGTSGRAP